MGRVFNRSELASALEVAVSTIDLWLQQGMPFLERPKKKGQSGWKIDLARVFEWHRDKWSKPEPASEGAAHLVKAQLRKESALADLRELEYRQKQGELIPVVDAQNAWASLVRLTRNRISAMPNAVCERLAAMTDPGEVRQFLMADLDGRMNQLAEEFQRSAVAALDNGGEGDAPAEPADGDGMGGEESETEQ